MTRLPTPWRDRAPKIDPKSRCCWVCGRLGGNGFTLALKMAGYRMAEGEMGYAHSTCMQNAMRQHNKKVADEIVTSGPVIGRVLS
jgi:hypothetical protein